MYYSLLYGNSTDWSQLSQGEKLTIFGLLGIVALGGIIYYFYDKYKKNKEQ